MPNLIKGGRAGSSVFVCQNLLEKLEEYESITGVPVEALVAEALDDYIEADLTSRMEALTEKCGQS
jgi:hypothetical protein